MIHGVRPEGRKDRLIDLKMRFCGISCSCDFCGSYYDCCLTMRISFKPLLCFKMGRPIVDGPLKFSYFVGRRLKF